MPYWVLAVALAVLLVAALYGLERLRPWRHELGRDADGDFGDADAGKKAGVAGGRMQPAE